MMGNSGMKDKMLEKILEILMSLKGSEEMEQESEGLPEESSMDGALEEKELPMKAMN